MPTRLIELKDGILVEAEVSEEEAQPISTSAVERVFWSVSVVLLPMLGRKLIRIWRLSKLKLRSTLALKEKVISM